MIWVSLALAGKPPIPGNPKQDACDAAGLQTALEASDLGVFAAGVLAACPGMPPEAGEWMQARAAGAPSPRAGLACPRAKGDLKRAVSPGFEARMKGVQKTCRIRGWKAEDAVGPRALLLGWTIAGRLEEGGIDKDLARAVGQRLAGMEGGRIPGRYGSIAAMADDRVLPEARNVLAPLPLPGEGPVPVWVMGARTPASAVAAEADRGGWLAVLPPEGTLGEEAPVYGIGFDACEGPASLRLSVSSTEVRLAFGAAGDEVEARGKEAEQEIQVAREAMSAAQEFGDGEVPDRIWVRPVDTVEIGRLVEIVDLLHHSDGTPRFDAMCLALEGTLVDWPERVDATGM
ncbi:MAG: hypothetical protein R3F61_21725 [Myxococcota bacterium]